MISGRTLLWVTPILGSIAAGLVLLAIGIDRLLPHHGPDTRAYVGAWMAAAVLGSALLSALMPRHRKH